jgi:hypothetical protein
VTAIAAEWVQAIWMTKAHSTSFRGFAFSMRLSAAFTAISDTPAIWQPCGSLKLEQGRVYEVAGSRPHCSLQPVPPILMLSVWWVGLRYVAVDAVQLYPDRGPRSSRDGYKVARFLAHHRSYSLRKLIIDFTQRRSSIASAVNVPST